MVLKGQYIQAERASYNNREYFTLLTLKAQYIRAEREQATITENISLWDGVFSMSKLAFETYRLKLKSRCVTCDRK